MRHSARCAGHRPARDAPGAAASCPLGRSGGGGGGGRRRRRRRGPGRGGAAGGRAGRGGGQDADAGGTSCASPRAPAPGPASGPNGRTPGRAGEPRGTRPGRGARPAPAPAPATARPGPGRPQAPGTCSPRGPASPGRRRPQAGPPRGADPGRRPGSRCSRWSRGAGPEPRAGFGALPPAPTTAGESPPTSARPLLSAPSLGPGRPRQPRRRGRSGVPRKSPGWPCASRLFLDGGASGMSRLHAVAFTSQPLLTTPP
ncbi:hypothetical protein H8959_008028 [Pygathrix nigripes]